MSPWSRPMLTFACLALAWAVSWHGAAQTGADAQALFFQGLDMKEAGDCEGAVARFQLALQTNPELHQARLYLAECYQDLDLCEQATAELRTYLDTDFPGAEVDRACALLKGCGADHPDCRGGGTTVTPPPPPPTAVAWSPVTLEVGAALLHFDNLVAMTSLGPQFAGRVVPFRWMEVRASFALTGAIPGPETGRIEVPVFSFGAMFSMPLGPLRVFGGVEVPLVVSRLDLEMRVDGGIMGIGGVRVVLPDTPLVLGGQFGGGHLVTPAVTGSIHVGVQLGPRTGGSE